MAFVHQDYLEAHRPWSFTTAGGRTFIAKPLSANQQLKFELMLSEALKADHTSPRRGRERERHQRRAWWWVLRRAFPWRFSYLLIGDPVDVILNKIDRHARKAALNDFFGFLQGETSPTPLQSQRTNGTR